MRGGRKRSMLHGISLPAPSRGTGTRALLQTFEGAMYTVSSEVLEDQRCAGGGDARRHGGYRVQETLPGRAAVHQVSGTGRKLRRPEWTETWWGSEVRPLSCCRRGGRTSFVKSSSREADKLQPIEPCDVPMVRVGFVSPEPLRPVPSTTACSGSPVRVNDVEGVAADVTRRDVLLQAQRRAKPSRPPSHLPAFSVTS